MNMNIYMDTIEINNLNYNIAETDNKYILTSTKKNKYGYYKEIEYPKNKNNIKEKIEEFVLYRMF